jgi:hypothetical protein
MGSIMNKGFALLAGVAAAILTVPADAATMVSFAGWSGALPNGTAVIEDFEAPANGQAIQSPQTGQVKSIGTLAFTYSQSVGGMSARPAFGSTGDFATVLSNGSYSIAFAPTALFAFVLGSVDTYNKLTLGYEDGSSQAYAGGQIINDLVFPSGNQILGDTNGVVSYRVTSGPRITSATFTSTGNSFEFDNISVAAVPEPATWAMMIGGFGLIGAVARRRKRATLAFA